MRYQGNEVVNVLFDGIQVDEIMFNGISAWKRVFSLSIENNINDLNVRGFAISQGWDGSAPLEIFVASGVVISSTSDEPAVVIDGSFPGGLLIENQGFWIGRGGAGGAGRNATATSNSPSISGGSSGGSGSAALSCSSVSNIQIDNAAGVIAGGGGGGGGGGSAARHHSNISTSNETLVTTTYRYASSGSGGGGGRSSNQGSAFGLAGVATVSGGNVRQATNGNPGSAGSYATSGNGGALPPVAGSGSLTVRGGAGGAGGEWGASGSNGGNPSIGSTTGSHVTAGGLSGGPAGQAVIGNANIHWISTGTRLGVIA